MVPLFRQIAPCLNSLHLQVTKKALYLWYNDHIESLIRQNRRVILRIIFHALEKNGHSHWNQVVQSFTLNVRKIFLILILNDMRRVSRRLRKAKRDQTIIWSHLEVPRRDFLSRAANGEAVYFPNIVASQTSWAPSLVDLTLFNAKFLLVFAQRSWMLMNYHFFFK